MHVEFAVDHGEEGAVRIDHERRPLARQWSEAFYAKQLRNAAIWIGEQRKAERVLLVEALLPIHRIGADSRSLGADFRKLGRQIAKMTALPGSARCHGLGVEEQHQRTVGQQPRQADRISGLIDSGEIGNSILFAHDASQTVSLQR